MVVVHPALDVPQAGGDLVRDLCVRRGKGEKGRERVGYRKIEGEMPIFCQLAYT